MIDLVGDSFLKNFGSVVVCHMYDDLLVLTWYNGELNSFESYKSNSKRKRIVSSLFPDLNFISCSGLVDLDVFVCDWIYVKDSSRKGKHRVEAEEFEIEAY